MKLLQTITLLLAVGCRTTGWPDVVSAVPASEGREPQIVRVRDTGAVVLPAQGAWRGESDGVATIGELLLIEGREFGRQVEVTIDGKPAKVMGRTQGGGVLARVGGGTSTGKVLLTLSSGHGRAQTSLLVRRLATVVFDGRLYLLDASKELRLVGAALGVPGAESIRLSSDGAFGYVLASRRDGDRLLMVELGGSAGPKLVAEESLRHPAFLLASAAWAHLVAIVGSGKLTLVDVENPRRPKARDPIELPGNMQSLDAADVSPDGKLLALLSTRQNRLLVLDVSAAPALRIVLDEDLLPGEARPLARDVVFSSDRGLVVISGGGADTQPPAEMTLLTTVALPRPNPGDPLLLMRHTESLPGAGAPLRIDLDRTVASHVYLTCVNDRLFEMGKLQLGTAAGARAAAALWQPGQPGMVVEIGPDGTGPLLLTPHLMSSLAVAEGKLLATAVRVRFSSAKDAATAEWGVLKSGLDRLAPKPEFLPLGSIPAVAVRPPFRFGEIRIQP